MGKQYRTYNGLKVTLLTTELPSKNGYNVVGYLNDGSLYLWTKDGKYRDNQYIGGDRRGMDLVECLSGFINVYSNKAILFLKQKKRLIDLMQIELFVLIYLHTMLPEFFSSRMI